MNGLLFPTPLRAKTPHFLPGALLADPRIPSGYGPSYFGVDVSVAACTASGKMVGSVSNAVVLVLGTGSPSKVRQSVVGRVPVVVKGFHPRRTWADEDFKDKSVDQPLNTLAAESDLPMAGGVRALGSASPEGSGPDSTLIRYVVPGLKTWDRTPAFCVRIGRRRNASMGTGHEWSISNNSVHGGRLMATQHYFIERSV